METTILPVGTESRDEPLVIPLSLRSNLKSNANVILAEARKSGKISTRSIAAFIRPQTMSDRRLLQNTVSSLDGFLASIGVNLARGGVDFEMRTMPLPQFRSSASLSINFRSLDNRDLQLLHGIENQQLDFDGSDSALYQEVFRRCPVLPNEQLIELFKKREEGDIEAQHLLVLHNLKLVFSCARKWLGRGLDFTDLVQEGIIGLMKAIEKFDRLLGYHFSTYALWWIRSKIQMAIINRSRTIRLPAHLVEKYHAIVKARMKLITSLGRDPTEDEIGDDVGLPGRFISKILKSVADTESGSLDEPIGHDEDSGDSYGTISDDNSLSPSSALEAKEALEEVAAEIRAFLIQLTSIPGLDGRDRLIFRMRYGIGETYFTRSSLETVGLKFGVGRERIRQIVEECWERLRSSGFRQDENWLTSKLNQLEQLENVAGTLTEV